MVRKWWHDKIAYQIYPKSFLDANGDGIGDLEGILSKLDYLKDLGVDILWLCPIYQSPFVDQGYDISDYYAIAEEFGTMEQFDTLLAEAKKRDMHIIMDLVINHCSDQHQWFQKALADPEGEYGSYFHFRKGRNGNPPNICRSYFGGSCWEKVPGSEYYYLHMFAKEQPDLNWENPKVRKTLYDMVNWWLDKGLAGFRVDAIMNIRKDTAFCDDTPDGPDGLTGCWRMQRSVQSVGEYLTELRDNTFRKYDAFTVGEVFDTGDGGLASFIGDEGYFSTIFDFKTHSLYDGTHGWYDSPAKTFALLRKTVFDSQLEGFGTCFKSNIIENHDEPRGVSRYLPDYAQTAEGAKMLGTVSMLLRGIPFLYQGQEIGMRNAPWSDIREFDDISTKEQYRAALVGGCSEAEALAVVGAMSRDNARTPMQWSAEENAGFSTGKPWLKVNPNYREINVAAQEKDPNSVLNYYRTLIALRKSPEFKDLFTYGTIEPAFLDRENIMAYYRVLEGKRVLVAANFGRETAELNPAYLVKGLLLSNQRGTDLSALKSCQVVVLECECE